MRHHSRHIYIYIYYVPVSVGMSVACLRKQRWYSLGQRRCLTVCCLPPGCRSNGTGEDLCSHTLSPWQTPPGEQHVRRAHIQGPQLHFNMNEAPGCFENMLPAALIRSQFGSWFTFTVHLHCPVHETGDCYYTMCGCFNSYN